MNDIDFLIFINLQCNFHKPLKFIIKHNHQFIIPKAFHLFLNPISILLYVNFKIQNSELVFSDFFLTTGAVFSPVNSEIWTEESAFINLVRGMNFRLLKGSKEIESGRKKKIMRKLGCLHEQAESFYVEVSLKQLNRAQTSLFLWNLLYPPFRRKIHCNNIIKQLETKKDSDWLFNIPKG